MRASRSWSVGSCAPAEHARTVDRHAARPRGELRVGPNAATATSSPRVGGKRTTRAVAGGDELSPHFFARRARDRRITALVRPRGRARDAAASRSLRTPVARATHSHGARTSLPPPAHPSPGVYPTVRSSDRPSPFAGTRASSALSFANTGASARANGDSAARTTTGARALTHSSTA